VGPVEAGQGLDGVHAAELLVHVHGVEQRLVEPRLEFVGDDEEPVLGPLERIPGLRLGDPVEVGLGVLDPAVADGAGEGDEGAVIVPLLLEVPLQRPVVADGVEAGPGHDHGLGAAVDPVGDVLVEVLHHDPDLLADGVVVELDEGPEQAVRPSAPSSRSPDQRSLGQPGRSPKPHRIQRDIPYGGLRVHKIEWLRNRETSAIVGLCSPAKLQ
jgi:hypothetical protein